MRISLFTVFLITGAAFSGALSLASAQDDQDQRTPLQALEDRKIDLLTANRQQEELLKIYFRDEKKRIDALEDGEEKQKAGRRLREEVQARQKKQKEYLKIQLDIIRDEENKLRGKKVSRPSEGGQPKKPARRSMTKKELKQRKLAQEKGEIKTRLQKAAEEKVSETPVPDSGLPPSHFPTHKPAIAEPAIPLSQDDEKAKEVITPWGESALDALRPQQEQ